MSLSSQQNYQLVPNPFFGQVLRVGSESVFFCIVELEIFHLVARLVFDFGYQLSKCFEHFVFYMI